MTGHIVDTVREDHNEIQACYGRIVSSADRQEQIRFQNLFTWALARNTVGKELVVYPAYEKHLSAGAATAEKRRKQNRAVSNLPAGARSARRPWTLIDSPARSKSI